MGRNGIVEDKGSVSAKIPASAPSTPMISKSKTPDSNFSRHKHYFVEDIIEGFYLDPVLPVSWEINIGAPEENAILRKLLLVCVHGNEQCGMNAVNHLLETGWLLHQNTLLKSKKHRLKIILANPMAAKINKRFVDVNLNRIFNDTFMNINKNVSLDLFSKVQYELTRLPKIAKAIEWCDYLLDVHSTSANTAPFSICPDDPLSQGFACTFPVESVVKNLSNLVIGTTIEWAHHLSKISTCVECGQHNDPLTLQVAVECVKRFVSDRIEHLAHSIVACKTSIRIRSGFHFLKPVSAFQNVQHREILAEDDLGPIECPFQSGAVLVMPNQNPVFGEEAFFWGNSEPVKLNRLPVIFSRN